MKSFFLNKIVYYITAFAAVLYVSSFYFPVLIQAGNIVLLFLGISMLVDIALVYSKRKGISGSRHTPQRWSNGDSNKVTLQFENHYSFPVAASVIDELPFQFQERDWQRHLDIPAATVREIIYQVHPQERGEYEYGDINIFISSPLRLVLRRYVIPATETVKVYPSYIQMRRYQLLAASNKLQEAGVKRIRRLGHSMEFEQIKEYVRGDDYRTINWKATARKGDLMVNNYTDERSQQIYCVINKGRVMKMPFEGMTLLDYAINASLVLCNVALVRQDKAGLITFAENLDTFLPADKKPTQMNLVLESLYRQKTRFLEPDVEKLYSVIRNRITHRSLLVLFTNFESMESLQRELPSLKLIARYHLLLVVIFENTELKKLQESKPSSIEDIYIHTVANKFAVEKRQMIKELHANGIVAVLSSPENLTVNTINKYLELKTRMSI